MVKSHGVKRKIVLRTPIEAMMDMDEAKDVIQDIIPEEADITEMYFDACYREVIIQCPNPARRLVVEVRTATPFGIKPVGPSRLSERHLFFENGHDIRMYRQTHGDERRNC